MARYTLEWHREVGDDELTYQVEATVFPYRPAVIGHPDRSYPAEGGEVEIERVTLDGKDIDVDSISEKEYAQLQERFFELASEDDSGYDEDWDDR